MGHVSGLNACLVFCFIGNVVITKFLDSFLLEELSWQMFDQTCDVTRISFGAEPFTPIHLLPNYM
jgi:hypothetical protein